MSAPEKQILPHDIKAYRKSVSYTQQMLAEKLGVSKRTIINYEKGGEIPESTRKLLHLLMSQGGKYVHSDENNIVNEPNGIWVNYNSFFSEVTDSQERATVGTI